MSNREEREGEDAYERENDAAPIPDEIVDNTYVDETNPYLKNRVPVQADEDDYEDPMQPPYSNSDQQLGKCRRASQWGQMLMGWQRTMKMRPWTSPIFSKGIACVMRSLARPTSTMRGRTKTICRPIFVTDSQECPA